ncbi:hypothetical protein [Streptococcus ruminantium]|uniref:hypothetical protein n=1 Tax=Streptococcus ruminantium TaxID=1917441 RepID=UPI0012DF819A|nr:hypothetical protein [Streptococcus ruminantium]
MTELKNGYKVEIPNGRKPITVRIMNSGSGGREKPYFRVSVDSKGSFDINGDLSSDRGLTHIDVSQDSLKQIQQIITKYRGE